MTREEQLEKELRRWVIYYRFNRFECLCCAGKWTEYQNKLGHERHTRSCILFREGMAEAPEPPPIPF